MTGLIRALSSQAIKVIVKIIVKWEGKMLERGTNHYYENYRIKEIALFRVPKPLVNDEGL